MKKVGNKSEVEKERVKIGLEIHAQLDTFKLFCNCFSTMDEEPRKEVVRKLHPVPGEEGKIDIAAKYEFEKNKEFVYQVFNDTSCLIENDDEPPREVNQQALDIAITLANMFGCYIPDEVYFMRKTVINGSNTSGFQRTGLVGINGVLKTNFGKVGITNLQLEEDSCGIVKKSGEKMVYRMDRLGIPLIEIGTLPDASTPEEAQELAQTIGMYLKSTGKIKKGLNAIRQDVNVSIPGGNRVEIKGVQSLSGVSKAVEMEVERQKSLKKLNERLSKLRFSQIEDLSDLFKLSGCNILKGRKVYGLRISHGKGLFSSILQGEKTLGKELAEYVRVQTISKGYLHTDEDLKKYNISDEEVSKFNVLFKSQANDLVVIVSDFPNALTKIIERIAEFVTGVPSEVRNFNEDGTTSYMRPMPGKSRMYPETDVKPVLISLKKVKVPKLISERINSLSKKYNLKEDISKSLINSNYFEIFEEYGNIDSSFVASVITSYLKDAEKRKPLEIEDVREILNLWKSKKISKDGVQDLIKGASEGKDIRLVYEEKYNSKKDLDSIVKEILKNNREYVLEKGERAIKPLMGKVMIEVRGSISGDLIYKKLEERIKEEIKNGGKK